MSDLHVIFTTGYGTGKREKENYRDYLTVVPRKGDTVKFPRDPRQWIVRNVTWYPNAQRVEIDIGTTP